MLYWLFVFIYFTYSTCFFIFRYCGGADLWLKPGKVHSSQFILRGQDQDRAGRLVENDWGFFLCFQIAFFSLLTLFTLPFDASIYLVCIQKQSLIAISALVVQWVSVLEAKSPSICLKGWAQMEASKLSYCTSKLHREAHKSEVHTYSHLCIYYSLSVPP